MTTARGIESLKTAGSAHIHSIPNTHRSMYLDLFMLQKEKEKLGKETKKIKNRLKNNMNRLKEIEDQMAVLLAQEKEMRSPRKKSPPAKERAEVPPSQDRPEWATMRVNY